MPQKSLQSENALIKEYKIFVPNMIDTELLV